MGNQHLAGAMAAFHKTSKCGCYFKKYPLKWNNLFTFTSGNHESHKVILLPHITLARALAEIGNRRPCKPAPSEAINLFPDEVKGKFPEGAMKKVVVNAHERDRRTRQQCIRKYGRKCCICRLLFDKRYGKQFDSLIHVHHLRPLHKIGKEYQIDPIKDLRPICPNCHPVVHRRNPAYTIEEVQSFLSK